jgi:voltage-gated potassium channel
METRMPDPPHGQSASDHQRQRLLDRLATVLEWPMALLGFIWLVLVVIDLTRGLPPHLVTANNIIWGLFIVQFLVEFTIAPRKVVYLRHNWLTAIALMLPALRIFRVARLLRVLRGARGVSVVRVVGTANRGMRALGRVMGRRGMGYVVALTLLVNLLGGAGMYAFERGVTDGQVTGFWSALWWTAMTLTTMGSDYYPRTAEGRVLGLLLAVYGFAVFGYVTAALASLFIAQDAEVEDGEVAGAAQIDALRQQVAELTAQVSALVRSERRG